jgi:tetratricopeptide (TPR) repeat protein
MPRTVARLYDGAMAQLRLGRALRVGGNAETALPHLEQARQRFERLDEKGMVGLALTEKGDCLSDLGRYDEAADAHLLAISFAETRQ